MDSRPDLLSNSIVGLGTCLIETTLTDVADPFNNIMIRVVKLWLKNFQISDFQTGA